MLDDYYEKVHSQYEFARDNLATAGGMGAGRISQEGGADISK